MNRGYCENTIENVHISPLGPPGPTENYFLLRGVVMFGFKMLGLVNFDKRECYVLFITQEKSIPFPLLGPPGPTDNACLLVVVVIF